MSTSVELAIPITTKNNFVNITEREFDYLSEGLLKNVKIKQQMAECEFSFSVPIYFLNLCKSHFNDTIRSVRTLLKLMKSGSEKTNLEETCDNLIHQLSIHNFELDYYLKSTLKHCEKKTEKFKRSCDKDIRDLMFIPINLHVEKMLVTTNTTTNPQTEAYEFTSCGASTCFQGKDENARKEDTFNKKNSSYIYKTFYTLKTIISLTDELERCVGSNSNKELFAKFLYPFKLHLQTLCDDVWPSFLEAFTTEFIYNDVFRNQVDFLKVKFNALLIEANFRITQLINNTARSENCFSEGYLTSLISTLINFLNLFVEKFISISTFVEDCAIFSQTLTTAITSAHLRLFGYYVKPEPSKFYNTIEFYKKYGLLIQYESLLSCAFHETYKLSDHIKGSEYLNHVAINVPKLNSYSESDFDFSTLEIEVHRDGFHVYLYTHNQTSKFETMKFFPVLINVGINELAVSSYLLGKNELQNITISRTYDRLSTYLTKCSNDLQHDKKLEASSLIQNFQYQLSFKNRSSSFFSRPIELLKLASDLCRLLNGIRITNCKSGKDRTGMSVSLEQCHLLRKYHRLSESQFQSLLDRLRRDGTRNHNLFKNIGINRYAFGKLRLNLLPPEYRPPADTCATAET